jgi:aminoglycoside phosphotransferase (APT) family kinase protein
MAGRTFTIDIEKNRNCAMNEIAERANSAHTVSLIHTQGRLCVRKHSKKLDRRFEEAIRKQREFNLLSLGNLCVEAVNITEIEKNEDSVIGFLMPYIHGLSGDDFALFGSRETAKDMSRALNAILIDQMSRSSVISIPVETFTAKLAEVIATTRTSELNFLLQKAGRVLDALFANESSVLMPIGSCHGDLTLSNIIFSPTNVVFLVDFLPTFLESPLQDAAKIKQDIIYGWSFRRLDKPLQVKGTIFCRSIELSYLHHLDALFPKPSIALELMCLARVAPYVKDEATARWLTAALEICIDKYSVKN